MSLLRSPLRAVMQIGGDGFRINGPALSGFTFFERCPELSMRLSRYAVLQGMQAAQTAACNRFMNSGDGSPLILVAFQDRVDDGMLPLTHKFFTVCWARTARA